MLLVCRDSKTRQWTTFPLLLFPLESVPPTTPLIDKTTLPCFNTLPPYLLWTGDMQTTLQNFVSQHKNCLEWRHWKRHSGLGGSSDLFDVSHFVLRGYFNYLILKSLSMLERNIILRIKLWTLNTLELKTRESLEILTKFFSEMLSLNYSRDRRNTLSSCHFICSSYEVQVIDQCSLNPPDLKCKIFRLASHVRLSWTHLLAIVLAPNQTIVAVGRQ